MKSKSRAPYTEKNLDKLAADPSTNGARWIPDELPEGMTPGEIFNDQEQRDIFTNQVISLLHITTAKSRDKVTAALQNGGDASGLTLGEHFLLEQVATAFYLNLDNPTRKGEIADILHISPIEIWVDVRQTLLRMGGDEQSLPGLEPPEEQQIQENAKRVYDQQYLTLPKSIKKGSSKIDRFASFFPDTGEDTLPLDLVPGKVSYDIKWNVAGGRITPFDQEVEMAFSNLIDQGFLNKPTPPEGATPTEQTYCYLATFEQIYCMMNGTEPGKYIKPTALEPIKESILKLNKSDIHITEKRGNEVENIVSGRIADAIFLKQIRLHTGHVKEGVAFSRPGLNFMFEKHTNHLLTVKNDQLNISKGYYVQGVLGSGKTKISASKQVGAGWEHVKSSITELSVVIRRYLLMEIFRIRNAATNDPRGNKITYDALIKYEADPNLVEYTPEGMPRTVEGHPQERILKEWQTPAEKKSIENARAHRRKLVLEILGHFVAYGLIKGFKETTEGRKKTGVLIAVDKTKKALAGIKKETDLKRYQGGKKKKS